MRFKYEHANTQLCAHAPLAVPSARQARLREALHGVAGIDVEVIGDGVDILPLRVGHRLPRQAHIALWESWNRQQAAICTHLDNASLHCDVGMLTTHAAPGNQHNQSASSLSLPHNPAPCDCGGPSDTSSCGQ